MIETEFYVFNKLSCGVLQVFVHCIDFPHSFGIYLSFASREFHVKFTWFFTRSFLCLKEGLNVFYHFVGISETSQQTDNLLRRMTEFIKGEKIGQYYFFLHYYCKNNSFRILSFFSFSLSQVFIIYIK